jgi:carbamate kinase
MDFERILPSLPPHRSGVDLEAVVSLLNPNSHIYLFGDIFSMSIHGTKVPSPRKVATIQSIFRSHCSIRPNSIRGPIRAMGSKNTSNKPIAVIAFGGNALLKRGEELSMENQQKNATAAAAAIAQLTSLNNGMQLCLTHGNGPQVGLLAQLDESGPLDVLDAETQGQIGYLLETEVANELQGSNIDVVAMLSQVVVDPEDPAFQNPTKHIGRWYSKEEAEKLATEKGWSVAQDGDKWRRVVASPEPKAIVESRAIELLLKAGVMVIACGGGGIPVAVDKKSNRRHGVQAVVDKDAASALLAANLGAEWLIMLTDADAVYDPEQWPEKKVPLPSPIRCSEVEKRKFAAGSMGPKIKAACYFVKRTGGKAAVGSIENLIDILHGKSGTVVVADDYKEE